MNQRVNTYIALLFVFSLALLSHSIIDQKITLYDQFSFIPQTQLAQVGSSLNNGLVAHYTFDEGSGTTVVDNSVNSNNGTMSSGPSWMTGKVGSGALSFGEGSVKLNSRITSSGPFSVSLWIYPRTVSYAGGVIIGGLNVNSQLTINNRTLVTVRDNGTTGPMLDAVISKPFFANKWQHLVVTRDSGNAVKFYLDGENVTTGTPTFSITKYWDYIGNRSDGTVPFTGALDDLRIYDRVLDQNEITELVGMGNVAPIVDTQAPTVPANIVATVTSSSQINITWNPSTDNVAVTGYKVYRGGVEVHTAPSTTYEDAGLSANTPYSYTVLAYDAIGNQSDKSSPVSATTQSAQTGIEPIGVVSPANITEWYVSPFGTSAGTGSITSPWDLQTALSNQVKNIKPGHTLWLRGGTYGSGGNKVFSHRWDGLSGIPGSQITIRNYANERAIIDGGIFGSGTYLTFWGLEVMNSTPTRKISIFDRVGGFSVGGKGNKIINCIIHDVGHPGISGIPEGEIYGVIMWGNGIYDTSNPLYPNGLTRGSGMYLQNRYNNSYVTDSISFKEFTTGLKIYAQEGWVNGFTLEGNVVFDNNDITLEAIGITNPIEDVSWISNFSYTAPFDVGKPPQLGWVSTDMIRATVRGNYFVNGSNNPVSYTHLTLPTNREV